jgi:crotonobetainyl-CoA:carnitine CoA-transferase CaiB-like acyl-CoA transferase
VSAPLSGYRVLEIGSTVAGPFCGRLLADFGAEVIKVEDPRGDAVRSMGKRLHGRSLYAASIFRNKALVAIDLRTEQGRGLVADLAADSDVLIENFRPGNMEAWGMGYRALSERNPRLVMVRISGFGQDGPYRDRPGYGVIGEALSGLRYITGDPDRPPSRVAVSMTDYITGLYAAFGTVLALLARETTGRGQQIDAALYECAFSFMEPWVPAYDKLGHVAERSGSRLPESTPNNLYTTADHGFIHIAAPGDGPFRRLAAAMEMPELPRDARFATAVDRSANEDELDDIVAGWTGRHDLPDIERALAAVDVPASRIFSIADIFGDPHVAARGSIVRATDAQWGTVAMTRVVPRLSDTPGSIEWVGGHTGQDTDRVLSDRLGLDSDRLGQLRRAGVIGGGST